MKTDALYPLVMVVEDFEGTRLFLRRLLEMSGCRVVEAVNGTEAVERAEIDRPELILMDLNMPVLDGFAATLRIRERETTRAVPIIAVTAYDTAEARRAARAVGCNDYLAKPIDIGQVATILARHLRNAVTEHDVALPS